MKYKLAIFDMDGTILNTLEDLRDSLNVSLAVCNFPPRTLEEVRTFVGNGIHRTIEQAVPNEATSQQIETVFDYFENYYPSHCKIKTAPYDGVIETIQKIKASGGKTAVVSNKADIAVHKLCDIFFPNLFDYEIGQKPENKRKPSPDSVNEVLEKLSISSTDSVYIGDSEVDLATAKNSNMDCIAVSWGFRDKAFLASHGATCIVDKPMEIEAFF